MIIFVCQCFDWQDNRMVFEQFRLTTGFSYCPFCGERLEPKDNGRIVV